MPAKFFMIIGLYPDRKREYYEIIASNISKEEASYRYRQLLYGEDRQEFESIKIIEQKGKIL